MDLSECGLFDFGYTPLGIDHTQKKRGEIGYGYDHAFE